MIEIRNANTSVSLRVSDADQRIISGIACPFGQMDEIHGWEGDFLETWLPGSLAKTIRERGPQGSKKIKLLEQHDTRQYPIGLPILAEERAQGLYVEVRMADTAAGDTALSLVRGGIVDGFSVGFSAIEDRWTKKNVKTGLKVREIIEAKLHEISLVTFPALAGAAVTGTRISIPRTSYRQRLEALKGTSP